MHREHLCTSFWGEDDILALSKDATLLYLYLMLCDRAHGLTGLYTWSRTEASFHCKMRFEELDAAMAELVAAGKVVLFDDDLRGWLWVRNRTKWNVYSPQQAVGAERHLTVVPQEAKTQYLQKYHHLLTQAKGTK